MKVLLSGLSWCLHICGAAIYGSVLLGFAVLLSIPARHTGLGRHQLLTTFQRLGPALGLALGATIFGGIGLHLLAWGLHWPPAGSRGMLLAKYTVFFTLWVSSFHLEIWTLDPLRQETSDPLRHVERVIRQLQVNALLFLAVLLLSFL